MSQRKTHNPPSHFSSISPPFLPHFPYFFSNCFQEINVQTSKCRVPPSAINVFLKLGEHLNKQTAHCAKHFTQWPLGIQVHQSVPGRLLLHIAHPNHPHTSPLELIPFPNKQRRSSLPGQVPWNNRQQQISQGFSPTLPNQQQDMWQKI